MHIKKFCVFIPLFLMISGYGIDKAYGAHMLLPTVETQSGSLEKVGSATYRKYGFRIYSATLWAPKGVWQAQKPYALELRYARSLSKETVIDSVSDSIREQNIADDETLARWMELLNHALPSIEDGDTLIGLNIPGKDAMLFYNGQKIASIKDEDFSAAFFNIWLGSSADEDMRNALLGINP